MKPAALLEVVVAALDDLKAVDIRALDVTALTTITDYMVIASGRSNRQVKALAEHVEASARSRGVRAIGTEGVETSEWILIDLGDVIVHVMQPETRDFYQLEKLWELPERARKKI